MKITLWFLLITLFPPGVSHASKLTPESVKGTYYLGSPEQGESEVQLALGDKKGSTVLAIAPCTGCSPTTYSYLVEESITAGVPVFTTAGFYLFRYNDDSFIVVKPNAQLGHSAWSKITHANIYSKDINTARTVSRNTIERFALEISIRVLNEDIGELAHKTGNYHLAMPMVHLGSTQSKYHIELIDGDTKEINLTPCSRCTINRYTHLPDESSIIGRDIYQFGSNDYLFNIKEGVFIHTQTHSHRLGQVVWGQDNLFNVFSNNPLYIRQILVSAKKQIHIDNLMAKYFSTVKTEFDKRDATERKAKEHQEVIADQQTPSLLQSGTPELTNNQPSGSSSLDEKSSTK